MSAFTPTAAQRAAIESRGSAVLVSAGAGSGKTKVLTERLMRYLTDPENRRDIDSFLVITFTRAAAGELKGRIMEELSAAIAADPANRHLRRQSALIRRAQISTIHGFCGELLRRHGHRLGLAPDFGILEDDRAAAMKSAALEKVMDDSYEREKEYPGFLRLADTVGAGRDDKRLGELVLELHEKMQCHARPEKWAEEIIEQLRAPREDAAETPWGKEILDSLKQSAAYWAGEMDRLLAVMQAEERIFGAYGQSVAQTADALRELSRALERGWDAARGCLPVPFPKLGVLRKSPDPALSDAVKARRDACKDACKGMEKALSASSETMLRGMALTHDAMEALLRLTLRFDKQYAADKRRLSVLDYADLEHFAARLLTEEDGTPSELSRQVAEHYTEIMVDEYQDVSRVQDAIFRAVSGDGKNLFMVGDVKQSIYRFRLADPAIFTEKYDGYADWEIAPEGAPRRILLRENFRSRREVIDAANAVFAACMSRTLGEIDYDEAAALRCAASYPGESRRSELLLLDTGAASDATGTGFEMNVMVSLILGGMPLKGGMKSRGGTPCRGIQRRGDPSALAGQGRVGFPPGAGAPRHPRGGRARRRVLHLRGDRHGAEPARGPRQSPSGYRASRGAALALLLLHGGRAVRSARRRPGRRSVYGPAGLCRPQRKGESRAGCSHGPARRRAGSELLCAPLGDPGPLRSAGRGRRHGRRRETPRQSHGADLPLGAL